MCLFIFLVQATYTFVVTDELIVQEPDSLSRTAPE